MQFHFKNKSVLETLYLGEIGLEKENLRVDENGRLAQTPHPFPDDPSIERDFCENQVELVTKPYDSASSVWRNHALLHKRVTDSLQGLNSSEEYLWCFSNPPRFGSDDEIPIAHYTGLLKDKETYRKYLSEKYGKRKMLFSGIHYNFSFSDKLLKAEFEQSGYDDFKEFKNSLYLEIAQKAVNYSWLIVYLTAASSVIDKSYFKDRQDFEKNGSKYASFRCGELGYWNTFVPILNYESISEYVYSIEKYIESGMLKAASELYYPVRLKPRGANTAQNLLENGVNHIELRMLDLNPLTPVGIYLEDIAFLHMLLIYLLSTDDVFGTDEQKNAIGNMKLAALYDDENTKICFGKETLGIRDAALKVLQQMKQFFSDKPYSEYNGVLDYQIEKVVNPNKRYAVQVRKQFENDFFKKGLELSKSYSKALLNDDFDRQTN